MKATITLVAKGGNIRIKAENGITFAVPPDHAKALCPFLASGMTGRLTNRINGTPRFVPDAEPIEFVMRSRCKSLVRLDECPGIFSSLFSPSP